MSMMRKYRYWWQLIIATLLSIYTLAACAADQMIRIYTDDPQTITTLRESLDFWGADLNKGYFLFRVSEQDLVWLQQRHIDYVIDSVSTEIMKKRLMAAKVDSDAGSIPGYSCYRTVEQTYSDLQQLAVNHPDLASWVDFGDSWQKQQNRGGYDLFSLVISNKQSAQPKIPLVLMAAMHAREYTTAETAARFAGYLMQNYESDADIHWLLDYTEVHIIALLNPDGRKIAENAATRFKRKNHNNNFCADSLVDRGVDLNRNSTFLWGGIGSSGLSCSQTFRGPSAASEPETQAIEQYIAQVFSDQRPQSGSDDLTTPVADDTEGLFISLHSAVPVILFPWEGAEAISPNFDQLQTLGRKFGFYSHYPVCWDCIGFSAGTIVDQVYGEYGVAAYTFELGNDFFDSCDDYESTIFPDNLQSLLYALKAARRPYQEPAGPEVIDITLSDDVLDAGELLTVTAQADDQRFYSGGFGAEPSQNVSSAGYSIDVPPFLADALTPLQPADGVFDTASEQLTASISTDPLTPGRHLLFLVAEDSAGRRGVASAVFFEIQKSARIFQDQFE